MNNRNLFTAALAVVLGSTSALYYDDATAQAAAPGIMSGGIGISGMNSILQAQKDYRLKLVFTEPNGDYLANVGVKVRDHDGQTIESAKSNGPVVLMTLPPGYYALTSSLNGNSRTENIKVPAHGLDTYYVRLSEMKS